jgi:hypothetical protein
MGYLWLSKDYEAQTAAKAAQLGKPRLLILDGHNSHCSFEFLEYADAHNIVILCLPSHTTHRLQPCDVGVFGPLNSTWKKQVNKAVLS